MTGRELLNKLQEKIQEEGELDAVLDIPQLMHLKPWFEREHYEAYYDPKTPCPHSGTRWKLYDEVDRCGQCGRRIAELVTEEK
jgi:hypothetical protein